MNLPEELKIAFILWRDRSQGQFTQHTKPTKVEIQAIDPTWFYELDQMLYIDRYIQDISGFEAMINSPQTTTLGNNAAD